MFDMPRADDDSGPKTVSWCKDCIVEHPGAVLTGVRACEDCRVKRVECGLEEDRGKPGCKRWCHLCAVAHEGSVNMNATKRCEGRGSKS
jgi:hypothetical protein